MNGIRINQINVVRIKRVQTKTVQTKTKGAALMVVLVLLLSISIAGVSALRNGIFQQRMVSNSQVDVFALQATESAINSILEKGQRDANSFFQPVMTLGKQINCFNGVEFSQKYDDCLNMVAFGEVSPVVGSLGQLHAYTITEKKGVIPAMGYDVELFAFHLFDTTGVGYFNGEGKHYARANTQRWMRFGASSGFGALRPNDIQRQ